MQTPTRSLNTYGHIYLETQSRSSIRANLLCRRSSCHILCSRVSNILSFTLFLSQGMDRPWWLGRARIFVRLPILIHRSVPRGSWRSPHIDGSLLAGQRTISDFFKILDHAVRVLCVIYKLHNLDNALRPSDDPVERSSPGNIVAGNYLIHKFR